MAAHGIASLQHDILVCIAELVRPEDLQNLRLVDHSFHAAVRDAKVALRPKKSITTGQLGNLCFAFPNTARVDLRRTSDLTSIALLESLDLSLKHLDLRGCTWFLFTRLLSEELKCNFHCFARNYKFTFI